MSVRPEDLEAERDLGTALRSLVGSWIALVSLQLLAHFAFIARIYWLFKRSGEGRPWHDMPWLDGLGAALRFATVALSVLVIVAVVRYARATLAGDRELALGAAAGLILLLVIDVLQLGMQTLVSVKLMEPSMTWFKAERWVWKVEAAVNLAVLAALAAGMLMGSQRRGARTAPWMVLPLLATRAFSAITALSGWHPEGDPRRSMARFVVVHTSLVLAGVLATVLFIILLVRHARVVALRPRPDAAARALEAHATAAIARIIILVAAAVLLLPAMRSRSEGLIKVILVGGPLFAVLAGIVMVAATVRYAWSNVDGRPVVHLAAALFAAGLAIDLQSFLLMAGLFWGKGDLSDRAEMLIRLEPALALAAQLISIAALVAFLVSLAGVGRDRVREARARATWIGLSMASLVVLGAVFKRSTPLARSSSAGSLLVVGALLLIGAIVLFAAYVGLVRDTARALVAPASQAPPPPAA